jgi:hypothetical protein
MLGLNGHDHALRQTLCRTRLAIRRAGRHLAAMFETLHQLWDFHFIWLVTAVAGMLSLVSIMADRRRQARRHIDAVGFMPWTGISVGAMLVTLISLALSIKAGW